MGYAAPRALSDALSLLADGPRAIVAGGTDFFPSLGTDAPPPDMLDVTAIAGMRGITRGQGGGWRIGGATTWTDILRADLPPAFDGLRAAAREVGSVQIQNAGTVAGNLCNASPAADGVPPLLCLGAEVELQSLAETRRLPLDRFLTGVRRTARRGDELLTALHIPALPDAARGGFVKLGARRYLVISIAMAAAVVAQDDAGAITEARIAVGACSAVATRLPGLETALTGLHPRALDDPALWSAHLGPLAPIDDMRGTGRYRRAAAGELCARAVRSALA